MPLSPGQYVGGRYRIDALLGQGGMGAVYQAWDSRLSAQVALKEMSPQPGLDSQTLAGLRRQFQQEATVLAHLDHPHLVDVIDFSEEGGNAYLVMRYIAGESMAARIARQGPLVESQVLSWADQLLDALEYTHRQGVLHRDIKPQNVIIRPDGQAVLVDFGLVKLWDPRDPRTRTAMRGMGTPEYAPLEQYDPTAGHTDPRSDLYSLGATLYHALTGRVPPTVTSRILNPTALVPPRAIAPALHTRTEAALLRALEVQPGARFRSAAEMRAALVGGTVARSPSASVSPTISDVSRAHPEPVVPRTREAPPASPGVQPALALAPRRQARTNVLATISLWVGILSLVTCSGFGVGAIAGIVTGWIARQQIRKSGRTQKGDGSAVAGIILGVVNLLMGLFLLVYLVMNGGSV